ncbi:MAG: FKBP-type peptidyl-prolyl cis-trans isomerase [Lachnospiraceae bacterium]|nr:FKBP-type peptidyl-prolyl cis-trans isomerase [Lachnospiraceae bacterium]
MKKSFANALVLTLGIALLAGCSKDQTGQESSQGTVQESESTQAAAERNGVLGDGQKASDFVTLGEYKGLIITAVPETYTEQDYENQTQQIYFNYVTEEDGIKDRPVQLYDMTNIDYEGKKDGVAFEGGTAQGATLLIGSHTFIDGFEDGLIGVMPGETVDLNLKFPDNYANSAELAGQEVVFTVTVNFIPEMKDEKVSEIGAKDVSTVEELRAFVKEGMDAQAQEEYLQEAQDEIWTQIMENVVFAEFPEDMQVRSREEYAVILDQMAASWGIDADTYAQMMGMTYDDMLTQYAEGYTKQLLIIQAIADAEDLNISDEELTARIKEYTDAAGLTEADLVTMGLTNEDFRQSYLYEDVMNFLMENAQKQNQ